MCRWNIWVPPSYFIFYHRLHWWISHNLDKFVKHILILLFAFWFLLFYFFICLVSGFWWYVLVSLIFPSFGKGAGKEGNDINIKIIFSGPLFIFLSLCDYNWFFNNNLTKCQKIKEVFSIFSVTKLSLHLYDPSFICRI